MSALAWMLLSLMWIGVWGYCCWHSRRGELFGPWLCLVLKNLSASPSGTISSSVANWAIHWVIEVVFIYVFVILHLPGQCQTKLNIIFSLKMLLWYLSGGCGRQKPVMCLPTCFYLSSFSLSSSSVISTINHLFISHDCCGREKLQKGFEREENMNLMNQLRSSNWGCSPAREGMGSVESK